MANSKDRRMPRGMLKTRTLEPQSPPPAKAPATNIPIWRRFPRWLYLLLVVCTLLVTLFEGYPWLSIQRDDSLNLADPFATMFSISNGGYIPLTNLDAHCVIGFNADSATLRAKTSDNGFTLKGFADWLWHDDRATVPCFDVVGHMITFQIPQEAKISKASLRIEITYSYARLNFAPLRRTQIFRFKSVMHHDKSLSWEFLH